MEESSLRKEASINAWKQLYDITLKLDKLEPWNDLGDTQLVTIQLKDREEPVFCSVMGKFSGERGIAVFDGMEGLGDFYMILGAEEGDLPAQYLMDEHSSLTCFWGSMMNVPDEQRSVIDELDIRFKTISDWIYFVSYKKGYKPYQLDEDEVALLTETYENLYMVLEAVKDGKLNPDIEQAEGIVRRYNSENDTWEMFVKEIPEELLNGYDKMQKEKVEDKFENSDYGWKYGNRESKVKTYTFETNSYEVKKQVPATAGFQYRTAESFLSSLNKKDSFDISKYQEGQRVYHKKFGEGTINKVEEEGEDYKIDINFDKVGHKRLMAKFAGLEII